MIKIPFYTRTQRLTRQQIRVGLRVEMTSFTGRDIQGTITGVVESKRGIARRINVHWDHNLTSTCGFPIDYACHVACMRVLPFGL